MSDDLRLKAYPFCGESQEHPPQVALDSSPWESRYLFMVNCDNCGACGPADEDSDEAIKAWNIRA